MTSGDFLTHVAHGECRVRTNWLAQISSQAFFLVNSLNYSICVCWVSFFRCHLFVWLWSSDYSLSLCFLEWLSSRSDFIHFIIFYCLWTRYQRPVLWSKFSIHVGWYRYAKAQWNGCGTVSSGNIWLKKLTQISHSLWQRSTVCLSYKKWSGKAIRLCRSLNTSCHLCTKLHRIFYDWWCHFLRELIG